MHIILFDTPNSSGTVLRLALQQLQAHHRLQLAPFPLPYQARRLLLHLCLLLQLHPLPLLPLRLLQAPTTSIVRLLLRNVVQIPRVKVWALQECVALNMAGVARALIIVGIVVNREPALTTLLLQVLHIRRSLPHSRLLQLILDFSTVLTTEKTPGSLRMLVTGRLVPLSNKSMHILIL